MTMVAAKAKGMRLFIYANYGFDGGPHESVQAGAKIRAANGIKKPAPQKQGRFSL
jgi:hypothetical protein